MPRLRFSSDGSLTIVPKTQDDADRIAALQDTIRSNSDHLMSGAMEVSINMGVKWRSPELAAAVRAANPIPPGGKIITIGGRSSPILTGD